jgi:phage baseplate assembly protein W
VTPDFVGRGWAFPVRVDSTGGIALVSGDTEIAESIRLILSTGYGERPMRPDFGCGIGEFVFAPVDAGTAGRIAYEVRISLERWEPRIEVTDVLVTASAGDASTLYVDVHYVISGTNDPRNLVFPFYTIPTENPTPAGSAPGGQEG